MGGNRLTHVSLFAGIGGLGLAAEWAGFESVLQVEMNEYATKVLEKHWPNVKRIKDVREVNSDSIDRAVTVVSGGFPCQPFSQAGKRGGRDDDRYLWPEMLRVIRELSPTWIVGENVAGLLSINDGMEIESIIVDLENEGYEVLPTLYPAAGVGAPHKRDRVFIVAHRNGSGRKKRRRTEPIQKEYATAEYSGQNVADNDSVRMERKGPEQQTTGIDKCNRHNGWSVEPRLGGMVDEFSSRMDGGLTYANAKKSRIKEEMALETWEREPDGLPRVATGVKNRVARLKALGNAVVPAQAAPIFHAIAEVEKRGQK